MKINGSIVLYQNDRELLEKAIYSFLDTSMDVRLYLVDNSPTDGLRYLSDRDQRIEYIFSHENLGFGRAHNIAMRKSIEDRVPYHLVLNPDAYFQPGVLEELARYMDSHDDVANLSPKTFYPDGRLQYLCKLLPSPLELVVRRFISSDAIVQAINKNYELRDFAYDEILDVPSLSGCFMFLRTAHLEEIGLFDENIFMYMEDIDLNRRLHAKYRTCFYPKVCITHVHARESYKKNPLLLAHVRSTIYYFNKYGWFFDAFRREKNRSVKEAIKVLNERRVAAPLSDDPC